MIKVSIVGGSGYAGGELLRLLLGHPFVFINQVTSNRFTEHLATTTHPNLRGRTRIKYCHIDQLETCDLLLVCLPNTKSMEVMDQLQHVAPRIIDLGADFRLREAQIFEQWYGKKHDQTRLLSEFVYGIAEIHREKIRNAQFIACGGCEATAIILSLYPLTSNHLIELHGAIADVKIGSSAAGSKASGSSHHPERHGLLRSYKPTGHRHEAEIQQELGISVEMSSTAVNIVRGILATIHVQLKEEVTEKDVWRAYRKVYGKEPFIRLIKQRHGLYRYPEPKILWGTNYCDIGFEKSGGSNRLVVLSAIDNLVKGTAGQAVQCMNLMLGFPEETGLAFPGLHPI